MHLTNSADDQNSAPFIRRKQQLIAKLARLVPGSPNSTGAILETDGTLATTPKTIAEALKKHWEPIFKSKQIDEQLLEEWIIR